MIGFAGVLVATMSTELNAQLSDIALADIAGHLGMSHDATTWFTSLYTSAEVVGIFCPQVRIRPGKSASRQETKH